jgi:hypothetical protein
MSAGTTWKRRKNPRVILLVVSRHMCCCLLLCTSTVFFISFEVEKIEKIENFLFLKIFCDLLNLYINN